jgi:hypothetical protein
MTRVEFDKVADEKPYWLNVPKMLELTEQLKDLEAVAMVTMIIMEYARQGGVPIKGDSASLAKLVDKYHRSTLQLSTIEKMRPGLLRLIFDEDQAGYWTPKAGLVALDDPYATEDDDGA